MNSTLWKNIIEFDLDAPLSEYGFSTRLINENYWTSNFAQTAIIEYKKFMYLAAVSPEMVSPSPIIDTVWHQHLVFTQSYDNFCEVLEKKIAHVPSTHNKADFKTFFQAKKRTQILYEEHFGVQPAEFWEHATIYDSLSLPKAKISVPIILIIGILAFLPFTAGAYSALKLVYAKIDNPYFLIAYGLIVLISFMLLEVYNRNKLSFLIDKLDKRTFVFNLSAFELLFLRRNKLSEVIHGLVNQLIRKQQIKISSDRQLRVNDLDGMINNTTDTVNSDLELCVLETIRSHKKMDYTILIKQLISKPAFNKIDRTINNFKKYFNRSRFFTRMFILNFTILSIGLSLGTVRLLTGYFREKPIIILVIVLITYLTLAILYLRRLNSLIGTVTLPRYYEAHVVEEKLEQELWDWKYYYLGSAVFVGAFMPLIGSFRNSENSSWSGDSGSSGDSSGESGSSGDSSCGSSGCGSSCGGCGGGSD